MDFNDATSALKNGDKVRRAAWPQGQTLHLFGSSIFRGPELVVWQPSFFDFTATDWMIHVPRPGDQ
jgi:hypothetical protein